MFDRRGQFYLDAAGLDEDATLERALEAGAEDFQREGDQFVVSVSPNGFHAVEKGLRDAGLAVESAEIAMVPQNTVRIEGADADRMLRLMEALEDLDDVSKVFSNFDIDAAQLADVSG